MKKLTQLTGAALMFCASGLFAQTTSKQNNSPFIFSSFTTGTVYQKNGASLEAILDYNTVTQEMMFDQNGAKMVLDQVDNIDSIIIQNCVFVPVKSEFYEKLTNTPVALYAQYKSKAVKLSEANNSGSTMGGGIINGKKNDDKPGNYDMQWPQGYKPDTQIIYWLKKDNNFTLANNLKTYSKQFPGKEAAIEEFANSNHIQWNKIEDVIRLTEFANK